MMSVLRRLAWRMHRFALALAFVCPLFLLGCGTESSEGSPGGEGPPPSASADNMSCYEDELLVRAGIATDMTPRSEVLILFDRTTTLPTDVSASIQRHLAEMLSPGVKFTVASFSTYSAYEHNRIELTVAVDPELPEADRAGYGMGALRRLDRCLAQQLQTSARRLRDSLETLFNSANNESPRSDIAGAISAFSENVAQSRAPSKTVIVISDMLENSSVSSFYRNGEMRVIDPTAELQRIESAGLTAQLEGARVFVIGAGLVPEDVRSMRSNDEMRALREFWTVYFELAGATSIQIGQPLLVTPINAGN
jgi:hypothetical protein